MVSTVIERARHPLGGGRALFVAVLAGLVVACALLIGHAGHPGPDGGAGLPASAHHGVASGPAHHAAHTEAGPTLPAATAAMAGTASWVGADCGDCVGEQAAVMLGCITVMAVMAVALALSRRPQATTVVGGMRTRAPAVVVRPWAARRPSLIALGISRT